MEVGEVDDGARQRAAAQLADHDHVVVAVPFPPLHRGDARQPHPPASWNGDEYVRMIVETIDRVQSRSDAADEQTAAAVGERGHVGALFQRGRRAADAEHIGHRFIEHTTADQTSDCLRTQPMIGGLAACEGTVARGRELAHGTE